MSRFLTRVLLEVADDHEETEQWIVCKALVYCSDICSNTLIVPRGFRTDLASVPRLPVLYAIDGGKAVKAAVLHDYLYDCRMYSRKMSDDIFLEAMEVSGVGWFRRWRFYLSVRVGGGLRYNRSSEE